MKDRKYTPNPNPNPNPNPYPTPSMSPTIFNLPQDIIFDIFSRLPTKSLIQFQSVCTSSPPLISHPSFTNLHLTSSAAAVADNQRILIYYESTDYITHFSLRSPLTFQETLKLQLPHKPLNGYLQIVGSDTGLICLFDTNYYSNVGEVILWNPSIQKFKIIDNPHVVHGRFSHFVMGFGFVSRTCEFKVVEIAYDLECFKTMNYVSVYSLSTNSWEKKEGVSAPCYLTKGWSSNVFVNGFVNWLAFKDETRGASRVIMAFDLENERFRVYDLPKNIGPNYGQVSIDLYGEEGESLSLSLCARYVEVNVEKWDVWVMGDYGLVDSWKKVFVVSKSLLIPPLLMKNDREVLITMDDGKLMLFDAIKNEVKDLETVGLPRTFRAIRYTASLALLHG